LTLFGVPNCNAAASADMDLPVRAPPVIGTDPKVTPLANEELVLRLFSRVTNNCIALLIRELMKRASRCSSFWLRLDAINARTGLRLASEVGFEENHQASPLPV
jgi:hypothetical protein